MSEIPDRLKAALAHRYEIERELGRGGMATVYLAEDVRHERKVAVKVLRPELAASLGSERFLREIKIAANLNHPHILPVYDSGESNGFLYYVMPYVEGDSLRDRLSREGELPVPEAVRVLREVVDALTLAHAQGVVHRDIKPDNILLSGRHALVADFGVAKAVSEAAGRQKMTTAGVALGTPAYMAPEQAMAEPNVDHRADIYAIGAVAYELLTGHPPFGGHSAQAILTAHVTETPEPVTTRRSSVPQGLSDLVMKCLEKNPADRWQSAEELLPQLEALATPSGGITPTDTRPVRSVSGMPRIRMRWTVGVITVLSVAAVVAVIGVLKRSSAPGHLEGLDRVAVLPIENATGDTAQNYLAAGITRELITELTGAKVRVKGYRSVERYAGSDLPISEIARDIQADVLLLGSLHRLGDRVQLLLELTDPTTGENLWARNYEAGGDEFPVLTRSVAQDLAGELGVTSSEAPTVRADRVTSEAYAEYLLGKHQAERYTSDGFRRSIQHLTQAVAIDSSFAPAWAGLGYAYEIAASYGFAPAEEAHANAAGAIDRALALDPDLGLAHLALARLRQLRDWDFPGAEEAYQRAIELSPTSEAYELYGWFLEQWMGRADEGVRALEQAVEIDPTYVLMRLDLAWRLIGARDFDRAQREIDIALQLDSLYPETWAAQATIHATRGRYVAALAAIDRYGELAGEDVVGWRGYYQAMSGRDAQAREALTELEARGPDDLFAVVSRASIHVALGEPDTTFALLEQLMEARQAWSWFRAEWDPIRDDPRYRALLQQIGVSDR
jgi:serine/threonine-protein kinase